MGQRNVAFVFTLEAIYDSVFAFVVNMISSCYMWEELGSLNFQDMFTCKAKHTCFLLFLRNYTKLADLVFLCFNFFNFFNFFVFIVAYQAFQ